MDRDNSETIGHGLHERETVNVRFVGRPNFVNWSPLGLR
jgi:hypothetical protein